MNKNLVRQKLEDRSVVDETTGCWLWSGTIDRDGYGRIKLREVRASALMAHRVSYEVYIGPIPDGLQIDHLCRTRNCINPKHLEPVTCGDNIRRGPKVASGRCGKGHKFTEANTYSFRQGKYTMRRCRKCHAEYVRARKKRDVVSAEY